RPASVIKELVENSLDAGANRIDVRVDAGGKRLIQVSDNGHGMTGEQLRLAIKQHATSKLRSVEELFRIQTLGFRGEALPSIASVSHLVLESRPHDHDTGMALQLEGGQEVSFAPVVMPAGTRITVRRLFFSTPARLKFMKSDNTEAGHVVDFCQRMSLAYPDVAFRLQLNEREVMAVKAGQSERAMKERLNNVFGPTFADHCISFRGDHEFARLSGWLGVPAEARSSANAMHIFVNGRWVRDRLLNAAIREVYRDLLPRDRYPAMVMFLEMPPSEVDVNVHPAKLEVRFRNQGVVFAAVKRLLGNALASQGVVGVPAAPLPVVRPEFQTPTATLPAAVSRPVAPPVFQHAPSSYSLREPPQLPFNPPRREEPQQPQPVWDPPLGEALGQVFDSFIIARNRQGLVIVDQHAAHERIVYESLKRAYGEKKVPRQKLLIPEQMPLPPAEAERLRPWVAELAALGVVVEPFGRDTFVVRELPVHVAEGTAKELVWQMVEELEATGRTGALQERQEKMLVTMACHGSVRFGRRMSVMEMNALLRQIEATPLADWCGHGRPTHVQLNEEELRKLFNRR
ncbi:MAG: DNA mismatch repair endonuclease MutL, partial [Magnetococcales bacterium]|nr:DNA mismatch repair endonuclease MutL [Magnetococcales bacterium]